MIAAIDERKAGEALLYNKVGDVVAGGPPCQQFFHTFNDGDDVLVIDIPRKNRTYSGRFTRRFTGVSTGLRLEPVGAQVHDPASTDQEA